MTDDLTERVARALTEVSDGNTDAWLDWLGWAHAALAALQPGDDLGNGLHVSSKEYRIGYGESAARQAAEAMREQICAALTEMLKREHRLGQQSDESEHWYAEDVLENAITAIRALPLPGDET